MGNEGIFFLIFPTLWTLNLRIMWGCWTLICVIVRHCLTLVEDKERYHFRCGKWSHSRKTKGGVMVRLVWSTLAWGCTCGFPYPLCPVSRRIQLDLSSELCHPFLIFIPTVPILVWPHKNILSTIYSKLCAKCFKGFRKKNFFSCMRESRSKGRERRREKGRNRLSA